MLQEAGCWWLMPVIPATQEDQEDRALKPAPDK
jgi:hypothetical protein